MFGSSRQLPIQNFTARSNVACSMINAEDFASIRTRISSRAAGASVDHELLRPLGDLGIEVVQQHP